MKWDDDAYEHLKWELFDIVRKDLFPRDLEKITVKNLTDAIDKFISKLLVDKDK